MKYLADFVQFLIICLLILLCIQYGGTAKSDHTDVVQLLHSCGEPNDEVRHNIN